MELQVFIMNIQDKYMLKVNTNVNYDILLCSQASSDILLYLGS